MTKNIQNELLNHGLVDWLDLFYESINHPDSFNVNMDNMGIKRAVELIEFDKLSPEQMHLMKVDSGRKMVRFLDREEAVREERLEIAKTSLEEGLSIDLIAKITGLSKEEIEKLKRTTKRNRKIKIA